MAIDIGLIFTAVGAAKSVAEFAGLLDSIESKVDRLVRSELSAGLRTLEQAALSTSEQSSLLRDARGCFNKAASLEIGYRRVVALLGLALCHHWLDDEPNCARALEEILDINPVTTPKLAITAGLGEIREFNSISTLKLAITTRGDYRRYPAALLAKNPMVRYAALIFSSQARKDYRRKLVLDAVDASKEGSAIRRIQESVSRHVGKPISWLKELE
jgi:hypothetical protein